MNMEQVGIDRYVLETLMPDLVGHDRQPSAFLVYLFLWTETGEGVRSVAVNLRSISEGTGLSKRAVQDALDTLKHRRLVNVERESITAISEYTILMPWRR